MGVGNVFIKCVLIMNTVHWNFIQLTDGAIGLGKRQKVKTKGEQVNCNSFFSKSTNPRIAKL